MQTQAAESSIQDSEDLLHRHARKIVKHKLELYAYFSTYLVGLLFLWGVNLLTSPGHLWALWPSLAWCIGVVDQALHLLYYRKTASSRDQMIDKEMERLRGF